MIVNIVEPRARRVSGLTFLAKFLQQVADRFVQGGLRYGPPHRGRMYLSRLKKELAKYEEKGNAEFLLNVATYCCLEMIAPEHLLHHHNPFVESATRDKLETSNWTKLEEA